MSHRPPALQTLVSFSGTIPLDTLHVRAPRDRPGEARMPTGRVTLSPPKCLSGIAPVYLKSGVVPNQMLSAFRAMLDTAVPRLQTRHFVLAPTYEPVKRPGDLVHYYDSIWVVRGSGMQRLIVHQDETNENSFTPLAFYADSEEGHHDYRRMLNHLERCWYQYKAQNVV